MAGLDRETGRIIDGYSSALQSVEVIFSTRIGERVMRREFGAGLIELLGRRVTPRLFMVFRILLKLGIDTWEKRFSVRAVTINGSVDQLRLGEARFSVEVDWRPAAYASPPDYSVADVRTFGLRFLDRNIVVGA